jgi:hypothetical protein
MDVVKERNYDFRKRMLEVHKPGRRDFHVLPSENEIQVDETWEIVLPEDTARVLKIAANDLQDYFAVSMKVFLKLRITDNIATEIASLSRKIILTNKRLSPEYGKDLDTQRSYRFLSKAHSFTWIVVVQQFAINLPRLIM